MDNKKFKQDLDFILDGDVDRLRDEMLNLGLIEYREHDQRPGVQILRKTRMVLPQDFRVQALYMACKSGNDRMLDFVYSYIIPSRLYTLEFSLGLEYHYGIVKGIGISMKILNGNLNMHDQSHLLQARKVISKFQNEFIRHLLSNCGCDHLVPLLIGL